MINSFSQTPTTDHCNKHPIISTKSNYLLNKAAFQSRPPYLYIKQTNPPNYIQIYIYD